jgi:hypothetical protein
MIEWLLAPVDPARVHEVGPFLSWHARTMVLAWGVLVPFGILAARYFKVMPGQDWPRHLDNRAWWRAHRTAHSIAGLAMLVGLVLVLVSPVPASGRTGALWLHRALGWSLMALAFMQFSSALLRGTKGGPTSPAADGSPRGDHFDMTARRIVFETIHKFGGLFAAAVSVPAILTGLWQANAPRWMWLALIALWFALCILVVLLERYRGALDTYQAIWGPDVNLPGNRLPPIGLGVRRRSE